MGYMNGSPEHENKYLIDGLTRMTLIKKVMTEEIIPTIGGVVQNLKLSATIKLCAG